MARLQLLRHVDNRFLLFVLGLCLQLATFPGLVHSQHFRHMSANSPGYG